MENKNNNQRKKITQNEFILFFGLVFSFFSVLMPWYIQNNVFSYSGLAFFGGGIVSFASIVSMIIMILPFADVELDDLISNLKISDEKMIFFGSVITLASLSLNLVLVFLRILFDLNNRSFGSGFFFGIITLLILFFGIKKYKEENKLDWKLSEDRVKKINRDSEFQENDSFLEEESSLEEEENDDKND